MRTLTIEVDIDFENEPTTAGEIINNLIAEMTVVMERAYDADPTLNNASGLILSPMEDDELVGNWRVD